MKCTCPVELPKLVIRISGSSREGKEKSGQICSALCLSISFCRCIAIRHIFYKDAENCYSTEAARFLPEDEYTVFGFDLGKCQDGTSRSDSGYVYHLLLYSNMSSDEGFRCH